MLVVVVVVVVVVAERVHARMGGPMRSRGSWHIVATTLIPTFTTTLILTSSPPRSPSSSLGEFAVARSRPAHARCPTEPPKRITSSR